MRQSRGCNSKASNSYLVLSEVGTILFETQNLKATQTYAVALKCSSHTFFAPFEIFQSILLASTQMAISILYANSK